MKKDNRTELEKLADTLIETEHLKEEIEELKEELNWLKFEKWRTK